MTYLRGRVGPRVGMEEQKYLLPLPGIETRLLGHPASSYPGSLLLGIKFLILKDVRNINLLN
jgi:hypothetical protein